MTVAGEADGQAKRVRGKRPPEGEPVIDRALALLAAFDAGHRVLTLRELSRRSGIPVSSALRLAGRLVAWGALERGEDGRYTVGLRLLAVARRVGYALRTAAQSISRQLGGPSALDARQAALQPAAGPARG